MKAVAQVVKQAQVRVKNSAVGRIEHGLLVFLAVHKNDEEKDLAKMAKKLSELRIFENSEGKLKRSIQDTGGKLLLIPQFTLYANCDKGTTPDFSEAAPPEKGNKLFKELVKALQNKGIAVETGEFGAFMEVESTNNGPITIIINT